MSADAGIHLRPGDLWRLIVERSNPKGPNDGMPTRLRPRRQEFSSPICYEFSSPICYNGFRLGRPASRSRSADDYPDRAGRPRPFSWNDPPRRAMLARAFKATLDAQKDARKG